MYELVGPIVGGLTFSGIIISSKEMHCGVGALLQKLPASLVGQFAASLGIGHDRILSDVGLVDWTTMSFSEQGAHGQGLGDVELPDLGEGIRTVVVIVSNGRTERKANVGGEC
jgi:hypothetical protein